MLMGDSPGLGTSLGPSLTVPARPPHTLREPPALHAVVTAPQGLRKLTDSLSLRTRLAALSWGTGVGTALASAPFSHNLSRGP